MQLPSISRLSILALISMPSAVLVQGRDLCYTDKRDTYPYAVTEWFCGSPKTCCSTRDTSDGELLWGCIESGETCNRQAVLYSDGPGFEVTDDGYGDGEDKGSDGGDDDSAAPVYAASLPAVVGSVVVAAAMMGM